MEYYTAVKITEWLVYTKTWMNSMIVIVMLSVKDRHKREREKIILFDFIYMKFKKQVLEVRTVITHRGNYWEGAWEGSGCCSGCVLLIDLGAGYTGVLCENSSNRTLCFVCFWYVGCTSMKSLLKRVKIILKRMNHS